MKGYFRKRGSKWSFTIDIGIDPSTGKRRQKSVGGFKTKREAQAACSEMQQAINSKSFVDNDTILFKDIAETWFESYKASSKVSSTRARSFQLKLLLKHLSYMKLKNINVAAYQKVLNTLHEEGYALNTISGVHSTGRMIFKKALEFDLIKKNPTDFAKPIRKVDTIEELENQEQTLKFLEKEELSIFLKRALTNGLPQDKYIFPLLAYSGIRIGELIALKWPDIDFDDNTINITKTIYNPKNNDKDYLLLTPKTKGSIRKIKIDDNIINSLKHHKKEQNLLKMYHRDEYVDNNFIFTKPSGHPMLQKTINWRMTRLLNQTDINKHLTPHSLRHTHTSLLIEAGVGIKEIQQRLGHTDIETTMNIYAHLTSDMEEKASKKFSDLMKKVF